MTETESPEFLKVPRLLLLLKTFLPIVCSLGNEMFYTSVSLLCLAFDICLLAYKEVEENGW